MQLAVLFCTQLAICAGCLFSIPYGDSCPSWLFDLAIRTEHPSWLSIRTLFFFQLPVGTR